jgi:tetratricopeptide (TPR) repeat protein
MSRSHPPCRLRVGAGFALLLPLALLLCGCGHGPPPAPALEAVPEPSLEQLDPFGRRQLEQLLADFHGLQRRQPPPRPAALGLAYGRLGQVLDTYGFDTAAGAAYRNAMRLRPRDYRWPYLLAVQFQEAGHRQAAMAGLERALTLIQHNGKGVPPQQVVAGLVRLGELHLDAGDADTARRMYQQALRIQPRSGTAEAGLGKAAQAQGRLPEAIAHLEKALELAPQAGVLHYRLAQVYRQTGELTQARAHLKAFQARQRNLPLLVRDPLVEALSALAANPQALTRQADTLAKLGRPRQALGLYRRALALDPDFVPAHLNLAVVLQRLGEDQAALAHLRRVIRIAPNHALAHANLGLGLYRLGRPAEALEHLFTAERLAPDDRENRLALGRVLLEQRRPREALARFAVVVAADPANATALLGRAAALQALGRAADALAALEEAHSRLPEDAHVDHELGRFLLFQAPPDQQEPARGLALVVAAAHGEAVARYAVTAAQAYAREQDWPQAAHWQARAIALTKAAGAAAEGLQAALDDYRGKAAAALEH